MKDVGLVINPKVSTLILVGKKGQFKLVSSDLSATTLGSPHLLPVGLSISIQSRNSEGKKNKRLVCFTELG